MTYDGAARLYAGRIKHRQQREHSPKAGLCSHHTQLLRNLKSNWKSVRRNATTLLLVTSIILLGLGSIQNKTESVEDQSSSGLLQTLRAGHKRLFQQSSDLSEPDELVACPILPSELGLVGTVPVNLTAPTWEELENMYPYLEDGGVWSPRDCVARSRVAVVVPYRDREYNLRAFLQHMHAFLQKQKLQYGIIVAEQAGNTTFNRGIMRNIGFREANLNNEYDCTTFNDVDLLPENDMNSYGCPDLPRHMCIALDYFDYKPIASGAIFGGIVSFRNDHFWRVNGYSNLYFGWGGEDDDIMSRCKRTGVGYYRARPQYGRYKGIPHKKDHRIQSTYKLWRFREGRAEKDGLNSLDYQVLSREKRALYTWVLVDVDENKYQEEAEKYLAVMTQMERNSTSNSNKKIKAQPKKPRTQERNRTRTAGTADNTGQKLNEQKPQLKNSRRDIATKFRVQIENISKEKH